jgi:hypothetical protein
LDPNSFALLLQAERKLSGTSKQKIKDLIKNEKGHLSATDVGCGGHSRRLTVVMMMYVGVSKKIC